MLQRRIEREHRTAGRGEVPAQRAIATLESTVDRRTRALLESEARYRALFDHSPYMVLTVDARGTITSTNATALNSFDGHESLVDLDLASLFREESQAEVASLLKATRAEAHELTLVDGRIVDINLAKLPGFAGAQVLLRDVSERVALARELQHSRRLAAIGHLAAGVSHEINNPLTVLQLGLVELKENLLGDEAMEVSDLIAHCDRIANIVSNLHTFAEPRPSLGEVLRVRDLLGAAKRKAGESLGSVGLMMSLEHRDLSVFADRRQIEQVLVNLLGNAARAMGGRGHLNVTAEGREGHVVITISDEGPGISEERLHQIFTPFVGREPTPGNSFGVGLVLSMSWGLLQENGGTLRATNRPSGGANFELTLPAPASGLGASQTQPLDSFPRDSRPSTPALRILCVEDEEVLQRTLLRLLELDGHQPTGVSSAEEGLDLLADQEFDVVISDLRLPKMSGDTLAETIRARHPQLADRILLMSGFFRDADSTPDFLQKPFTARQLGVALAALVGRPSPSNARAK